MATHALEWTYNYETLAKLSGWPVNKIQQDTTRGRMQPGRLADAVLWLAENGAPELRAEIAKRLLPVVLGLHRPNHHAKEIGNLVSGLDLLQQVFRRDEQARRLRAKKIRSGRKSKSSA